MTTPYSTYHGMKGGRTVIAIQQNKIVPRQNQIYFNLNIWCNKNNFEDQQFSSRKLAVSIGAKIEMCFKLMQEFEIGWVSNVLN